MQGIYKVGHAMPCHALKLRSGIQRSIQGISI
jgi:hypothetical protein